MSLLEGARSDDIPQRITPPTTAPHAAESEWYRVDTCRWVAPNMLLPDVRSE